MKKLFHYRQNNSGGYLAENENLCKHVIIEASNAKEANSIAEELGIYFNGVETDRDCDCCGDRWYMVDDDYYIMPEDLEKEILQMTYDCVENEIFAKIHYLNGEVVDCVIDRPNTSWNKFDAIWHKAIKKPELCSVESSSTLQVLSDIIANSEETNTSQKDMIAEIQTLKNELDLANKKIERLDRKVLGLMNLVNPVV